MHIPLIYILVSIEALFILLVACIILGIYAYKLSQRPVSGAAAVAEENVVNPGSTYADFLAHEIMRNETQVHTIKMMTPDADESTTQPGSPSALLKLREEFLQSERLAADFAANEPAFWQQIYKGMKDVFEKFHQVETRIVVETEAHTEVRHNTEEKVFYIETQGKKIDGELNHLKDIIYDQENTMSGLKKALKRALDKTTETQTHDSETAQVVTELHNQIENFERQLRDAKTCMDVLELENNRLQEEVSALEQRYAEIFGEKQAEPEEESGSPIDIDQLRRILKEQERKISELTKAIDEMQLDKEQAERLKGTLNDFVRNSREMMNCIVILEEENDRMQGLLGGSTAPGADTPEQIQELKAKLAQLEEEVIKKDIAYAKLQEEFASMEKEYLAMYNAIHGNNG